MTDQEIKEKIQGYLALIAAGENEADVQDAINAFCSQFGDRGFDIKREVEVE